MKYPLTRMDVRKIKEQLRRMRIACFAAIELGDCHAVARLTCEAARLRNRLSLAGAMAPQIG